MDPKYTCSIPLEQFEYEICDGLLGHAISAINQSFQGVEFNKINLSEEDQTCPVWRRYEHLRVNMTDFSFDVGNDLLVLAATPLGDRCVDLSLTVSRPDTVSAAKVLHLRMLSADADHPLATETILIGPGNEEWTYSDIKIVGPYLAVHFGSSTSIGPEEGRLCVWRWQTGDLLYVSRTWSGQSLSHDD